MIKLLAFIAICLFYNLEAFACSCISQEPSGFVRKHSQLLPANAKGVLFYRDPVHFYFRDDKNIKVVPLQSKDFQLKDKTTNKIIAIRVVQMKDAEHTWKQATAGLFKNATKNEQGKFDRSVGLFRVEPIEGFVAKHTYEIKYIGQPKLKSLNPQSGRKELVSEDPFANREALEIQIAEKLIDLKKLNHIKYKSAGPPKVEELFVVTGGGSCSTRIQAAVERMKLEIDSELNDYAESFLIFTYIREGKADFKPWKFQTALCSPSHYGHIEAHKYFRACGKVINFGKNRDYSDTRIDEVSASWGLLEVEDKLHTSQGLPTYFDDVLAKDCKELSLEDR